MDKMDFFEIKLNSCFSTIYRINDIISIRPNIRSKIEIDDDVKSLLKSCEPYNEENAEVMSYNITFKSGIVITISCLDYEVLKEKIKKLQGGVL